jgi:acetolactate synthase-1/2/3 large subunit
MTITENRAASVTTERPAGPMRVADWLMDALAQQGVRHVFMVSGGGAMHLDDAAGAHPDLAVVCTLHEQAAAIAAETYTKASGRLALCLVTTGPGGTNAVTGVAGAWLDSTPMIVVSGQVKRDDLVGTTGVRQRGVQEVDIVSVVAPITKEAVLVTDPTRIRYHLERALHIATTGRPGPVWLDIPLDVQAAPVDIEAMEGFDPAELGSAPQLTGAPVGAVADEILEALAAAERPLVLVGAGVRLSGAERRVRALVESLGVPVLSTWPAQGVIGDDHPLFVGRPGPLAPRGANFALQNADFLLCLGARLDLVTTGYDPASFGRNARKFVVDIDPAELAKLDGAVEGAICADVGEVVGALLARPRRDANRDLTAWRAQCRSWRDAYPIVTEECRTAGGFVSTYHLADVVSDLLAEDDVLAPCSSGLGLEIFLLALRLHTGQRATYTTALGAMGYGPPAAVGACLGSGGKRTICVDGDGGLQLNAQELETIRRLHLPIKLLVLANDGYASIRASQQRWFGRLSGADATSGVTLPPLDALARAYGLPHVKIDGHAPLEPQLRAVFDMAGPVLCEVPTPPEEPRQPSQISEATADGGMRSRPLEDLAPLLSRDELAANMPFVTVE